MVSALCCTPKELLLLHSLPLVVSGRGRDILIQNLSVSLGWMWLSGELCSANGAACAG